MDLLNAKNSSTTPGSSQSALRKILPRGNTPRQYPALVRCLQEPFVLKHLLCFFQEFVQRHGALAFG